jgi:XRE family transcriptional regulator, regulator of sulfur utilization
MSKAKSTTPPSRPVVTEDHPGDEVGAAELGRRVADNLRRLRKERALSLDQLAAASGVSRAALSQIEGSKTNPTLAVLWKIAVGLAVPFQALLGAENIGRASVLRAGDTPPMRTADGRMESRLLSPAGASPGVEVYELRFLSRGTLRSEAHGTGTTETLVVLTGTLRMIVADEVHDLAPGDSIHFRADVPHTYENSSAREARCLNVIVYGRSGN